MAIFNSNAIATGAPVPGFGAGGGQVRTQYTSLTLPVGATTTDSINFFKLPQGARILRVLGKNDALGGAVTLDVGDAGYQNSAGVTVVADPDRYVAAQAVATAGSWQVLPLTGLFVRLGRYPVMITGRLAAGTVATAGTIELAIEYTVEEPQA